MKEFKATCPVSKWSGLQVYSRATSRNAKRFLAYLQEQAPFPIRSLQVDGGSEFRDEFEQACQEANCLKIADLLRFPLLLTGRTLDFFSDFR